MQLVIYKSWDTHTLYMSLVESVLKKNYVLWAHHLQLVQNKIFLSVCLRSDLLLQTQKEI